MMDSRPAQSSADAASGRAPDPDALRGTRFEFGGRRPYAFVPKHLPASQQRALPGIGTVALGKVGRVAPYGAFVDFLGFRGMVHISQLMPGYRVERVEDVVQPGDEVVVRVIAIDPERRHINLALVGAGPGAAASLHAAVAPTAARAGVPAASPGAAPPDVLPQHGTERVPDGPPAPVPPRNGHPGVETPPEATGAAGPPAAPPVLPVPAAPPPAARPAAVTTPPPHWKPAPVTSQPLRPVQPVPPARAAAHPSRAVRRDAVDPRHPMARLLAAAGDAAFRPAEGKEGLAATPQPARPSADAVAGSVPVAEPARPVHVAEPEPEPDDGQPATLESLAARFGHRPEQRGTPAARQAAERSRQEREKQAAILARLRRGG